MWEYPENSNDAKCGGRDNSAMWRMLKDLLPFDQPFKLFSERLVLSAHKFPSPATRVGQTKDVVPVDLKESTSRKRQRIDLELEPLPVNGDTVSRISQYSWFYTKGDNLKRSAIPVTRYLAVTHLHGDNKHFVSGDCIRLISYQNQQRIVDSKVVCIDDSLDLIVLQSKSAEFCNRDLIWEAVEPKKGMPYILMGFSAMQEQSSHISFFAGIISSDTTSRLRFLGSSGSFKGGESCWSDEGRLIGMQVENQKVLHKTDKDERPGDRCGIIPITCIRAVILKFLPPEEDVEWVINE